MVKRQGGGRFEAVRANLDLEEEDDHAARPPAQSTKSSDYHVDVSTVMRPFRPRCRLDSVPSLFSWNLAAFGLPAKRGRASSRRDRKVDEADAFERGKHRAHSD